MHKRALIQVVAWILIAVGLLAAAPVLWQRWQVESQSRRVDLVLDLPAYRAFSRQEGYPLEQMLADLRAAGATSLAIPEMDLEAVAVKGFAALRKGTELRMALAAGAEANSFLARLAAAGRLDDEALYLLPASQQWHEYLYSTLLTRMGSERVEALLPGPGETGPGLIALKSTPEVLQTIGLGFDPADFELARQAGLRPLPRPRNQPAATEQSVAMLFAELERLAPEANSILFGSKVLPGWRPDQPETFQATIAGMKQGGYVLDMVEHYTQLGFAPAAGQEQLAAALDYRVARVYSMSQKEFDKYQPGDAMDKLARSVLERNIRVLYLRPLRVWQEPGMTVVETNLFYFRRLVQELQGMGYTPGGPDLFPAYWTPWWQRGFMGLAVVGAGILWLSMTWPFRRRFLLALAVLGAAGSFAAVYVAPRTGAQLLALAGAVIFPTLAGTWLLVRWRASARRDVLESGEGESEERYPLRGRSPLQEGLVAFSGFAGTALLGGLLVAGMLGDIRYLLEFDYFRGVKVTLIAPLALVAFSYLTLDRTGHPVQVARQVLREIWGLLDEVVRYRHVLLGLVGLLAVVYYLQRSGNFPTLPVSGLELKMRAFLEQALLARPRTKEFAISYPALALAVVVAIRGYRTWLLPLLLAAMTGAASIVNTFSHLRTPWAISLLRTVHGFWLGALVGLIVATFATLLLNWLQAGKAEGKETPRP